MNNKIRFTRIREVHVPTRNAGDAGSDFYVPENTEQFQIDLADKNVGNNIPPFFYYYNNIPIFRQY